MFEAMMTQPAMASRETECFRVMIKAPLVDLPVGVEHD